jgi:hypothetical protein
MLDTAAITSLIEQQINSIVSTQVLEALSDQQWLEEIESKIIQQTQARILQNFQSNAITPLIIETVKGVVLDLFNQGQLPGVETYIDSDQIQRAVNDSINKSVTKIVENPEWVKTIEPIMNKAVVGRTAITLGSIDVNTVIQRRVDEIFQQKLIENFTSTGIDDRATSCKLTIFDENTVVENKLIAPNIEILDTATVNDLVVKGAINIDNRSWDTLAAAISKKTLVELDKDWQARLVQEVKDSISQEGINFDNVIVGDNPLIQDGRLSSTITKTNIQQLGTLDSLTVNGTVNVLDTFNVSNGRVGVNTGAPESALSVWDEEVSVSIGKYKKDQAYFGTSRKQTLNIGTNKDPHIQIDPDGLTTISKLRVGQHMISHSPQLPGWSGTRGDIVFNSNPQEDAAFAWVCTGNFNWLELKIK